MKRPDVFNWLRGMNITRVEVDFSGGGDEGGTDEIRLYAGDKLVETLHEDHSGSEKSKLANALAGPVYDRYGSFAGEFYVNGTLVWDVGESKVTIDGRESVQTWRDVDEEV